MSGTIHIRNDVDFRIKGFYDKRTGSYLNAATGTWEIRTAKYAGGSQVATGSMDYVTGSNGEYVGGVDNAVALAEDTEYYLRITLAEGGVTGDWEQPVTGGRRLGTSKNG